MYEKFSSYMQRWLYGKNGYYASMPEIGKNGDFYTSVSTSMFFGGCVANYIIKRIDEGGLKKDILILEFGAHKGYLLADIIQFIFTLRPQILDSLSFGVVEPLENVRESQREYFNSSFGQNLHVNIYTSLDEIEKDEAFIISNELFDAFTCEIVNNDKMLYIEDKRAVFGKLSEEARELSQRYGIKKGEIVLGLEQFAKDLCKKFKRYEFVSFDYGDMGCRNDMSLRVYKNHQVHPFFSLTRFGGSEDIFESFFANADITYDVNFLHAKDAFTQTGAVMKRFCTQSVALNEFGFSHLLEILYKNADEQSYKKELEKAKMLILPSYFGERFKMIDFIYKHN